MVGEVNEHLKWAMTTRDGTMSVAYYETPSNSTGSKGVADVIIREFHDWGRVEIYEHIDHADGYPKVEIKDVEFVPNKPLEVKKL